MNIEDNSLEARLALAPDINPPNKFKLHQDGSVTVRFSPQFLAVLYDTVLIGLDEEWRHREHPTEQERQFREKLAQDEDGPEKIEAGRQYYNAVRAVVAHLQVLAFSSEERVLSPETIEAGKHVIDRAGCI